MIPCANPKAQNDTYAEAVAGAISSVVASGRYILGPEVEAFEHEFSDFCGVPFGVGVASGTDALQLALKAFGIGPGDEVVTTSHTAVATATAIHLAGAIPVFADITPDSLTLSPESVEHAISSKTKAIIAVHIYGHPCDMNQLAHIAKENDIFLIEDCAQAHGAAIGACKVGSLGDCGCFSFYPTKNLGAIGDGGMVVSKHEETSNKIKLLREYGWRERYVSSHSGANSRLDEIQAAILRVKLKGLVGDTIKRRKLAMRYQSRLKELPIILPSEPDQVESVYHLYVIRTSHRDALKKYLDANGIGSGIHYPLPVHKQPYFSTISRFGSLKITEKLSSEILSLPMFPELTFDQVDKVCEVIHNFFEVEGLT